MNKKDNVIILKNDAVGDLVQSLQAINNIINRNKDKTITMYLSERSKDFTFLFNKQNIKFKVLNYNLSLIDKINLLLDFLKINISSVYILTPKNYFFLLPLIFQKIKFYGLCLNGPNKYMRPNNFFRKYLYKYKINDRGAEFKRLSTMKIQSLLTNNDKDEIFEFKSDIQNSNLLKKFLPKDYVYFHVKKDIVDKLSWDIDKLEYFFNELLNYYDYVIFTKDIENDTNNDVFKKKFSVLNFSDESFDKKNKNIIFFDNIKGVDLYNTIKNASKIIAFHGMMTNLASIEKKSVIDLWFCNIKSWDDYRNYRNAFHEFKPVYLGYDFTIPKKNIQKTFNKIKFSLKKNND